MNPEVIDTYREILEEHEYDCVLLAIEVRRLRRRLNGVSE